MAHPDNDPSRRHRPVIGVLAQELDRRASAREFGLSAGDKSIKEQYCLVPASYVEFAQGAGAADVAPILIGQNVAYYERVMSKVNGVLLPGGALSFVEDGIGGAGMKIYEIAKRLNDQNDYFPLWGTCLGHQLLVHSSAKGVDRRGNVDNSNNLNKESRLTFRKDFRKSKLLKDMDDDTITLLETENNLLTFHHGRCVCEDILNDTSIVDTRWKVLATSRDSKGSEFVAMIEAESYPFYGVQFHPEKNLYEQNHKEIKVCTSDESLRINRYFADFFIKECRENLHEFENVEERNEHLIDNHDAIDTRNVSNSNYERCYLFKFKI